MDKIYSFFERLFQSPTPICDKCGVQTTSMYILYDGTGARHECVECRGDAERLK